MIRFESRCLHRYEAKISVNGFFERLREHIISPIVLEIRDTLGLSDEHELAITNEEEQVVFSLHATVAYTIIRSHVFSLPPPDKPNFLIEIYIDTFMRSIKDTFDRIHQLYGDSKSSVPIAPGIF